MHGFEGLILTGGTCLLVGLIGIYYKHRLDREDEARRRGAKKEPPAT